MLVCMCICHIRNQSLTNFTVHIQVYMQVYLHIYNPIYVQGAHNFDTFYATKLKFGMIFTKTKTLDFMVELPLGLAPGQGQGSECISGHIEHMQMGKGQRAGASLDTCLVSECSPQ